MNLAYDRLADVYDQWITGDPACESCLDFYLRRLADTVGRIVDGGVGTGRLAVELARRGRAVLGIDESLPMLERARHRARQLPGDASLGLCQMDLLSLGLRGVDVFVLPFRTIGHFVTLDARKRLLRQVFESLEPGGRFIFDHYVPDLEWAQVHHARPLKMFDEESNEIHIEIWDTYEFDLKLGLMHCSVDIRRQAVAALKGPRKANHENINFTFAWVYPDEVPRLAAATGFEVERVYGDFNGGAFSAQAQQQIWELRKPLKGVG